MIKEGGKENFYKMDNQLLYQQRVVAPDTKDELLPFKNLPLFAFPFIPLTYFPLSLSYRIFAYLNLILLGVFTLLLKRVFRNTRKVGLLSLIPFIYIPNIISIIVGQISIIMAITVLFLYKLFKEGKYFIAGLVSGILLIKLQYLTIIPFLFFIAREKKQYLSGFFVAASILAVSSIYFAGVEALAGYPSFLLQTENASFGIRSQRMLTVNSTIFYLKPFFVSGYRYALYANSLLYLGALYLFSKRHKLVALDNSFSSAIVFSLLFAVHVLEHDLTVLLVPVLLLANMAKGGRREVKGYYLFYALLLFLLPVIVIFISPVLGTITAVFVATTLLYPKETFLIKKKIIGRIFAIR